MAIPRKPQMVRPSADVETQPEPIAALFARSRIDTVTATQNRRLLKIQFEMLPIARSLGGRRR